MKIHVDEKIKLKKSLKGQWVYLTTDNWILIQNINYMCLITWIKNKLNFYQISNHKSKIIDQTTRSNMLKWEFSKMLTVTVYNGSCTLFYVYFFFSANTAIT